MEQCYNLRPAGGRSKASQSDKSQPQQQQTSNKTAANHQQTSNSPAPKQQQTRSSPTKEQHISRTEAEQQQSSTPKRNGSTVDQQTKNATRVYKPPEATRKHSRKPAKLHGNPTAQRNKSAADQHWVFVTSVSGSRCPKNLLKARKKDLWRNTFVSIYNLHVSWGDVGSMTTPASSEVC